MIETNKPPHLSPAMLIRQASASLTAIASALEGKAITLPPSVQVLQSPAPFVSSSGSLCLTVREIINELLIAKARADETDRYLRQLRVSLGSFAKGRGNKSLNEVTFGDLEKWLFNQGWKPKTMRGYLGDVRALFNFALKRGYISKNVALGIELPVDGSKDLPPGIHTPQQVRQVLEAARAADLDVMRHLAIRYFAGVRSAEAHRMTESDLHIERGFIEVPAV